MIQKFLKEYMRRNIDKEVHFIFVKDMQLIIFPTINSEKLNYIQRNLTMHVEINMTKVNIIKYDKSVVIWNNQITDIFTKECNKYRNINKY